MRFARDLPRPSARFRVSRESRDQEAGELVVHFITRRERER